MAFAPSRRRLPEPPRSVPSALRLFPSDHSLLTLYLSDLVMGLPYVDVEDRYLLTKTRSIEGQRPLPFPSPLAMPLAAHPSRAWSRLLRRHLPTRLSPDAPPPFFRHRAPPSDYLARAGPRPRRLNHAPSHQLAQDHRGQVRRNSRQRDQRDARLSGEYPAGEEERRRQAGPCRAVGATGARRRGLRQAQVRPPIVLPS